MKWERIYRLLAGTFGRSIDEEEGDLRRMFRERIRTFSSRLASSSVYQSGPEYSLNGLFNQQMGCLKSTSKLYKFFSNHDLNLFIRLQKKTIFLM